MPRSLLATAVAAATLAAGAASATAAEPPLVIPDGTYETTDSGGGTLSLNVSGGQVVVGVAGSAGTPCVEPGSISDPEPAAFFGPSQFSATCKGTLDGSPGMLWVGGREMQGRVMLTRK